MKIIGIFMIIFLIIACSTSGNYGKDQEETYTENEPLNNEITNIEILANTKDDIDNLIIREKYLFLDFRKEVSNILSKIVENNPLILRIWDVEWDFQVKLIKSAALGEYIQTNYLEENLKINFELTVEEVKNIYEECRKQLGLSVDEFNYVRRRYILKNSNYSANQITPP